MDQRQLLVLGNLKGVAMAALEVAQRDAGYDALLQPKADDAIAALDAGDYAALLVDLTTPGAARFCHEARARRALFNVPLIALSPKLTDLAFSNALRWGADDVVELGAAEPLSARLSGIPEKVAPIIEATRGEAVIADPERSRCDVLGRVLANAGFNVKYATDAVTTRFYLAKTSVKLFVLNTELGEPDELIHHARSAGSQADWVVTTKTLDVDGVRTKLKGTRNAMVMSSHGPPENVLFALNLLRPSAETQRRAEVRALYGAIVLFRPVGLERDEFGFTYSVSSRGLYLRTLLPPPSERLWVEMTPPNVPRRVKLLAEVAWSRTFGQAGAETAPPGFGVRILDGLGDDLKLWQQGFDSLDIKVPAGGVPDVATAISGSSFRVPLPSNPPPRISRAPSGSLSMRTSRLPKTSTSTSMSAASTYPRSASLRPSLHAKRPASPLSQPPRPKPSVNVKAEVVVPSSMWRSDDSTAEPRTHSPAASATASSQDAVLRAIRASLPPAARAKVAARSASRLPAAPHRDEPAVRPPEHAAPTSSSSPDDHSVAPTFEPDVPERTALTPNPHRTAPSPLAASTALESNESPATSRPVTSSSAPIDYEDEFPRPSAGRTVLGIGTPSLPVPAPSDAPAPPLGLEALDTPTAPPAFDSAPSSTPAPAPRGQPTRCAPDAADDSTQSSADDATTRSEAAEPALLPDDALVSIPPAPLPDTGARATSAIPTTTADETTADETTADETTADETTADETTATADHDRAAPTATDAATDELRSRTRTKPPPGSSGTRPSAGSNDERTPFEASGGPRPKSPNLARSALIAAAVTLTLLLVGVPLYQRLVRHDPGPPPAAAPLAAQPPVARSLSSPGSGTAQRIAPKTPSTVVVPTDSEVALQEPDGESVDEPGPAAHEQARSTPSDDDGAQETSPQSLTAQPPDRELLESLAPHEALLFVQSSADANVYVHGVEVGRTNRWLRSHCGFRFIRLGTAPGRWLSKGIPAKLRCRAANELELPPSP